MSRPSESDIVPPLLEAKLAPPRRRTSLLARPRILRAFDAGEASVLTLVAAPAGYGKTTAVREWCATVPTELVWVTLDAGDNDPVRFWTYVAAGVDRVREGLGRGALHRLRAPGARVESAIDELVNGLSAYDREVVLVLDDLHHVTSAECLATLDHLLGLLSPTARVVAISRADPALHLARLRASGSLTELRAHTLAFTLEEARALLEAMTDADVGDEELELLHRRTEGWPAALLLAGLWLRTVSDPRGSIREFGGDHRFVAEYLSQEVLEALDEDTLSFVLRASVLRELTPALCDAVLDRSDSLEVLASLERSHLFIERLEHGGWHRVHSLFAEFAEFQLESVAPGEAADIRRRAADWFGSQGLPAQAAQHAAAAHDHSLLAELLSEHHLALLRSGQAQTLLRWVREVPAESLVERPELAAVAAVAATMTGRSVVEQRRYLGLVERARIERPDRVGPYVEAAVGLVRAASVDDGIERALVAGRRAVEVAGRAADDVVVAALASYARALYLAGDLDEAWSVALRGIEHPDIERRVPGHAFARTTLALVAAERGHLAAAREHASKARSLLGGTGGRSWLGASASAALGVVLAAEGKLSEAERELVSAERLARDEVATLHHAWLLALVADVRVRRGRLDDAAAALRSAHEALADLPDAGRVPTLVAAVERSLAEARSRASDGELLAAPTAAELAVLRLLDSDLSAREIGERLFVSTNTVQTHTRALYRKLGVHSRIDAVARAGALGLLAETESPM